MTYIEMILNATENIPKINVTLSGGALLKNAPFVEM